MKYQDLETSIRRNGPAPLYLVIGEEDFLRDRALSCIGPAVLGEDSAQSFNCDVFYGDECKAADILNCVSDLPVFADRRLVLVKGAERLPARETDQLIAYLNAPNSSTTLLFSASKLDGRQKFAQTLKAKAVVIDCGPLPSHQVPGWIQAQSRELGLTLSDDAVPVVAELASHSLNLVRRELEKLAVSVTPGASATPADVEAVRGTEPGASVFDLSAAIAAGDRGRALRILARNLEAGEAPLRILGSLLWQYRRLWKAKALSEGGSAEGDIARVLSVPPFRLREFLGQARRFSGADLRLAFQWFLETDNALKGGSATSPERVLEALVLRLCLRSNDSLRGKTPREPSERTARASRTGKARPISMVRTVKSVKPVEKRSN